MLELDDLRVRIDGHEIIHIDRLDARARHTSRARRRVGIRQDDDREGHRRPPPRRGQGVRLRPVRRVASCSTMDDRQLSEIRGRKIGFVFQDPARSLNPMMRIGRQVSEAIRLHTGLKKAAVADKVIELLEQVQLPDPPAMVRRYPHQLSGGQQQRVMIAAAIAADPELLDRRRTDDGPRRHRPGGDPPAAHLAERAAPDERPVRQPRPRGDPLRVRPRSR